MTLTTVPATLPAPAPSGPGGAPSGEPAGTPLLEVRDLHVRFDADGARPVHAVSGVSFRLHRGETLAVVGESGSGKSTTALALAGMLPGTGRVTGGQVLLDGTDLVTASEPELRALRGSRIGMIFQDPMTALNPLLTVGRHIDEALRAHGARDRRARAARAVELLDLVGIPDPARRAREYPHQFSGGMRQRAMIALALANEPDVLLADEPTTALDATVQDQILTLLERLGRELGTAVVIITHNMGVVARSAERLLVMYGGRVVEQGTTAEVLATPRHPYTAGLLRAVPRLDAPYGTRLESIPGSPPDLTAPAPGCSFAPRCALAEDRCRGERPVLVAAPDGAAAASACHVTAGGPVPVRLTLSIAPDRGAEGARGDASTDADHGVAATPAAPGDGAGIGDAAPPAKPGHGADTGTERAPAPAPARGAAAVPGATGPAPSKDRSVPRGLRSPGTAPGFGVLGRAPWRRATGASAAPVRAPFPSFPASATSGALLRVEGLRKEFAGRGRSGWKHPVVALDGVDLALSAGETLGIVGESGCGKSTLARTLVGVHPATAGRVFLDGHEIDPAGRHGARELRRRVQMVFQDPYASLNPRMTVGDIIADPLVSQRIGSPDQRRRRVAELLDQVGLDPSVAERLPKEFSGGQRQRIGIARALAVEPSVLICDEPVSALDVSVQAQVVNLLTDLQERLGLALIFIAHDLAVVRQVSDRIAVMYLGQVVETGPATELTDRPVHPYTRALLSAAPVPDPVAERTRERVVLTGDVPSPAQRPVGCAFAGRCPIGPRVRDDHQLCGEREPVLAVPRGHGGHPVACHFADELLTIRAREEAA